MLTEGRDDGQNLPLYKHKEVHTGPLAHIDVHTPTPDPLTIHTHSATIRREHARQPALPVHGYTNTCSTQVPYIIHSKYTCICLDSHEPQVYET